MDVIIVTPAGFAEMRDNLQNDKKIAAIKALRAAAVPPQGERCIGLREAKLAVERYAAENTSWKGSVDPEAKKIVSGPFVKEITCDFGEGLVTIDVETMQLKALSQLESIGLEACGRMLELCQVIKAFSEGKNIGVIEPPKEAE